MWAGGRQLWNRIVGSRSHKPSLSLTGDGRGMWEWMKETERRWMGARNGVGVDHELAVRRSGEIVFWWSGRVDEQNIEWREGVLTETYRWIMKELEKKKCEKDEKRERENYNQWNELLTLSPHWRDGGWPCDPCELLWQRLTCPWSTAQFILKVPSNQDQFLSINLLHAVLDFMEWVPSGKGLTSSHKCSCRGKNTHQVNNQRTYEL